MTLAEPKDALEVFLQFSRSEFGDNAHVIPQKPLQYQRTDLASGKVSIATFPWESANVDKGLAALRTDAPKATDLAAFGGEIQRFLRDCRVDKPIEDAHAEKRPIRLTIRSAAAELYAIPWELAKLEDSGKTLAQMPNCTVRYTWPAAINRSVVSHVAPCREGGRILFAWSHGRQDEVPWTAHLEAIQSACAAMGGDETWRRVFFNPEHDVLAHASFTSIYEKLEQAAAQGQPYSIVHLLCHGGKLEGDEGFGVVLTAEDERDRGFSSDKRKVHDVYDLEKQVVAPDVLGTIFDGTGHDKPRLVVLCVCLGADPPEPGSHLGSVALAVHRTGIESVVASRFLLSWEGSILLAQVLYDSLLLGPTSLETAVDVARAKLRVKPGRMPDYAAIQLFQNTSGWDTRPVTFRPYRGLLAFGREHERYFFGRRREVQEIVNDFGKLVDGSLDENGQIRPRFLLVVGASGTGKSSLVLAGALPALLATYGFVWEQMHPDKDPLGTLDALLKRRIGSQKRLLIVVDQFEELFTHVKDNEARTQFVRALWALARGDTGISVLLTIRVDFLGHLGKIALDDEKSLCLDSVVYDENHRVFVAQMAPDKLLEVIEKPATLVGIGIEKGLAQQAIKDTGNEPGALPLVQFTLDQLWQQRVIKDGRETLTWEAYNHLGGVTGALAKRADSLVEAFDEKQKLAARRLLVQLVHVHDDALLDTRRRMRQNELRLGPGMDTALFNEVLAHFATERLLVTGQADETNESSAIVEIAHEQLVRSWKTLRTWLNEDRQRILECAPLKDWSKTARGSADFVLRGELLEQARVLKRKYEAYLEPSEMELIQRSEAAEAAIIEAERQQRKALEAALLRARTNALMSHARENLEANRPGVAAQLLAEVHEPDRTRGWTQLAMDLLTGSKVGPWSTRRHVDAVIMAKWSPDGQRFVTVSKDGSVQLWRADGTGEPTMIGNSHGFVAQAGAGDPLRNVMTEASVRFVAWSPDGHFIVIALRNGPVHICNANGSREVRELKGHDDCVFQAVWSPDGKYIVTASADKTARVWRTDGTVEPVVLRGHEGIVLSAAWSPNGEHIVTASADKTARIWRADGTDKPLVLRGHVGPVHSAAWSPNGEKIATISADKTVRVWHADGTGEPVVLGRHEEKVHSAVWSPNGEHVVITFDDLDAKIWRADGTGEPFDLTGTMPAWSPDGQRIVTACIRDVCVWRVSTVTDVLMLEGHEDTVTSVEWSPDGKRILSASFDKTARIWRVDGNDESVRVETDETKKSAVEWTPEGQRLIASSGDAFVSTLHSENADKRMLDSNLLDGVRFGVKSPDELHILTLSADNMVRIYRTDAPREPPILKVHHYGVSSAAWSRDGARIVTASQDGLTRVWCVGTKLLQQALRDTTTDCLTPHEREMYLDESSEEARTRYEAAERSYRRIPMPDILRAPRTS